METFKYSVLLFVLISSIYTDYKYYKIKNKLIVPCVIVGIIINIYGPGLNGLINSILGIIFPIITLFIFFALKMFGAGDIKLFVAVGAVMGIKFCINTMIYAFLIGAIWAIIKMIINKNIKQRFLYLLNYIKTTILGLTIIPYSDYKKKSKKNYIRFSTAVFLGVVTEYLMVIRGYSII